MNFEEHLKQPLVNMMKNIKQLEETEDVTQTEIKNALTYNLAISDTLNKIKSIEDFVNQTKLIKKQLNL